MVDAITETAEVVPLLQRSAERSTNVSPSADEAVFKLDLLLKVEVVKESGAS